MAARHSWKGFLKLSLVTVPVKAYPAVSGNEVRLHQVHAGECHSRIKHKKTCPVHGELKNDEIESGYEVGEGQLVIIDTDELEKLRTESEKAITIDTFTSAESIEPIFFSGKNYYLTPDGTVAEKPYALLYRAIKDEECVGIAQMVLFKREHIAMIRPFGNLLLLTALNYAGQVVDTKDLEAETPLGDTPKEQLELAKSLLRASSPKAFDLAKYTDTYTEKLTQLIEAKVAQAVEGAFAGENSCSRPRSSAGARSSQRTKRSSNATCCATSTPPPICAG